MFALYVSRRPRHYLAGLTAAAEAVAPWLATLIAPGLLILLFWLGG